MKYLVNGDEIEDPGSDSTISKGSDRLFVTTHGRTESALAVRVGDATWVSYQGHVYKVEPLNSRRARHSAVSSGEVLAPMPGVLVEVKVGVGEAVKKGQVLAILEAMKTQQPLVAPFDGNLESVPFTAGNQVEEGVLIAKVVPAS